MAETTGLGGGSLFIERLTGLRCKAHAVQALFMVKNMRTEQDFIDAGALDEALNTLPDIFRAANNGLT